MKSTNQEDDIRPCFVKMAKSMGCDYRNVKATYEKMKNGENKTKQAGRLDVLLDRHGLSSAGRLERKNDACLP